MFSDNFCYYVYKGSNIKDGILIDAADYGKVKSFKKAFDI
jgi:hypothetical protein